MQISVFGLGYVGCVSAACLAKEGHAVIGVDVNPSKVDTINRGRAPIVEKGIDDLIREVVTSGRLRATTDADGAVAASEASLVCVGTPSRDNGSLDVQYLVRSIREIGAALRSKGSYHVVIVRSTVLPGTLFREVLPVLEQESGKRVGIDIGLCINPEFLREASSLEDFYDPPFTLIGEFDERSGGVVSSMVHFLSAPVFHTDIPTAEMVKYATNAFHGLKVTFANEIGNLCKACNIDGWTVMSILCRDKKLNLSEYYLKPGFAFGGSCLPKDLRALTYHIRQHDLEAPVLDSILRSNELQIRRTLQRILRLKKNRIGILGLSFKAGTDDLRESPLVLLAENLLGKGCELRIYDSSVMLARLIGANKQFIEQGIPHIASLLFQDLDDVIAWSDVVVLGNRAAEFSGIAKKLNSHQFLIDLARAVDVRDVDPERYWGICW